MRRVSSSFAIALVAVASPPVAEKANAQAAPEIVAHTVDLSRRQAMLGLELADGSTVRISLARGVFRINDREAGRYAPGGPLERSWRELLVAAVDLTTPALKPRLAAWKVNGLPTAEAQIKQQMDVAFQELPGQAPGTENADDIAAAVAEGVSDAVAEVEAGRAQRRIDNRLRINGSPVSRGVGAVANNVAGLIGMFVALACIGFGLVSFAPRQLEAVADTVHRSFTRSFFAGLFAQPLLFPLLGMMIVGLALTIIGIVVVPVAIVAFVLAVALGLVGGYIAMARALGEILLRRRGADVDFSAGMSPYKASVVGLAGLLTIWLPFALLSEVPGAGWALLWAAIVVTWVMATAGFGATILSRGGVRHAFARPGIPVSGTYSWTGEVAAARSAMKELE